MNKILVTGASGFIGSFIVEEALRRDMEVWAAVRPTSSKRYLQDKRIRFITLDLGNPVLLEEQLSGHEFDYVVHAAGATKCLHKEDFFRVNTDGTKNLVDALCRLQMPLKKFVFISSLSVYGPARESQPYTEILESDTPQPNTAYGESKLKAEEEILKRRVESGTLSRNEDGGWRMENTSVSEQEVRGKEKEITGIKNGDKSISQSSILNPQSTFHIPQSSFLNPHSPENFPCVILRPTGVYGPREKDYYLMAKSIKKHVDFAAGYKQQDITFVYVKDVVQAVFLAMERGLPGRKYFLTDGHVYSSSTFSKLIHAELGCPWWVRVKAPIWLLRVITFFGEYIGHVTGKMSALNNDKYNILKQRNWRCDIRPAVEELGYKPEYDLERGVKETIKWYKENGWL